MRHPIGLSVAVLATCVPLSAWAVPVTVPTDLNPGDKYRLAFVTSTTRDATSSDIADYNGFVAGIAAGQPALAALGTTWTAIASTATVDARDNTGTNPLVSTGVPIYRLDDTRIAHNNGDLWDGALLASLSTNEGDLPFASDYVWTGTLIDGTRHPTNSAGSSQGVYGQWAAELSPVWINLADADSLTLNSLYAISAELTVVPEPGTLVLVSMGAAAWAGWLFRRKQREVIALRDSQSRVFNSIVGHIAAANRGERI